MDFNKDLDLLYAVTGAYTYIFIGGRRGGGSRYKFPLSQYKYVFFYAILIDTKAREMSTLDFHFIIFFEIKIVQGVFNAFFPNYLKVDLSFSKILARVDPQS